ncbi:MAG: PQQ-dependent sugar dehydrogenase, partial [Planctomycetaceae bacterium]|nr:PQQ-dependent sugar dehydrogenase [Planctomycetaceae bacterium]
SGKNYGIPADNPFVGVENARAENWAYGLRQPWKMHFDAETGVLWTGNVGQDLWEQIFIVERGGNYGWSVMEGSHPFRPERTRGPTPFVAPIVEHNHTEFRSITGGIVYHGSRLPELKGAYIYGDYDTGQIWMFRYDAATKQVSDHRQLVDSPLRLVGFAEGDRGEFALIDHTGGMLHQLVPNDTPDTSAQFPRKLSETGLFRSTDDLALAAGVVPYTVNAPQWCDGAVKQRYFGLPGDSQIEFEAVTYPQPAPGARPGWRFPDGTVIAETISLPMEAGNPNSLKRIETRILHYEALIGNEDFGNQYWRGYTYVWNDDQTDAELLDSAGGTRTFTIKDAAAPGGQRTQTWRYPSRAECTVCHNMAAKYVLGLTTEQTNCLANIDGRRMHQLRHLDGLQVFTSPLARAVTELPAVADYHNVDSPLDARARAYLHANCSHCHRKWGGGNTEFQFLASLALDKTGIVNTPPAHGGFFLPQAAVLAPSDPLRSVLYYRMAKLGSGRMPRLGSDVIDAEGVQLIHDWIASLPSDGASSRIIADERAVLDELVAANGIDPQRLETLLATSSGALLLMDAIDDGRVSGEMRSFVIVAGNASSQSHVRELFEKYLPEEQRPQRLGATIQAETILALEGDRTRGRRLFLETNGVLCKSCHKLEGQGTEVGPDLAQIGKKYERSKILDNILSPSREIDPKFTVYLAVTNDGRVLNGIMVEKTDATVSLKDNLGKVTQIKTEDIDTLTPQQQSLMPDLLLREMTADQVADLLAYLSSLK